MCKNVIERAITTAALILSTATMVGSARAQEVANHVKSGHVAITSLFPPAYPPIARHAHIVGQVKVEIIIRKDNSIESAYVISGQPILNQAVLDSVNKSKFECRECSGKDADYTLTYTFKIDTPSNQCDCIPTTPKISQLEDQITITAGPACLAPSPCGSAWVAAHDKFRSAKCLYLWKCGNHNTVLY